MKKPTDHQSPKSRSHARVDHRGRITALVADGEAEDAALIEAELAELEALSDDDRAGVTEWALAVARANALDWAIANQTAAGKPEDEIPALAQGIVEAMSSEELLDQFVDRAQTEAIIEAMAPAAPRLVERTTPITAGMDLAAKIAHLRERQAQRPEVERTSVTVVTASGEAQIEMAVRWDDEAWDPYKWDAEHGRMGAKGAFVSTLPEDSTDFAMVAAGDGVPAIVDNPGADWHAYLCIEGVRTDEGYVSRELMPESCQFPDLPVSLRLQVHDEGGHWGAVTCGRIDTMERSPYPEGDGLNAIAATGVFGTDEHGQTGQLLVDEQTQRFVSVDLRDMESEIVEIAVAVSVQTYDLCEAEDDDGVVYDWWMRVTSAVIGGATIVAMPALQQAVITLADVELPTAPLALERAPATAVSVSVTAAGAPGSPPLNPPAAWFESPAFHVGDPRLVRQPDGRFACPPTVTDDGQIFGHACYWGQEHTARPNGRRTTPPKSATYAYFQDGELVTSEGGKVAVGQITMGCGHADLNVPWQRAKDHYRPLAHYDGGYGAVQMADVRCGEDDFGVWFAGALRPLKSETNPDGPTAEQVRQFRAMDISPDWRKVAGSLHMLALLSVPVGGFPVAREALVAAAAEVIDLHAVRSGLDSRGEVTSLVAAGRVHRTSPEERLAVLERRFDVLFEDFDQRRRAKLIGELRASLEA